MNLTNQIPQNNAVDGAFGGAVARRVGQTGGDGCLVALETGDEGVQRWQVVATINPIIRGWAAYYRIGVSKRMFNALDAHMWRLVYKWAKFSHPNKSTRWVLARYFGTFNPARQDTWTFGSRETGFYLRKFAWTPIVRHRMVGGRHPRMTRP